MKDIYNYLDDPANTLTVVIIAAVLMGVMYLVIVTLAYLTDKK